jgi:hypothetical protein
VFRPGDAVLFRSSEPGRPWKPGVVDGLLAPGGKSPLGMLRLRTGPGCWVVRDPRRCRRRYPGRARAQPFGPNAARAVALNARGFLLREIGALLGISRQRVHQLVKRARETERSQPC